MAELTLAWWKANNKATPKTVDYSGFQTDLSSYEKCMKTFTSKQSSTKSPKGVDPEVTKVGKAAWGASQKLLGDITELLKKVTFPATKTILEDYKKKAEGASKGLTPFK